MWSLMTFDRFRFRKRTSLCSLHYEFYICCLAELFGRVYELLRVEVEE